MNTAIDRYEVSGAEFGAEFNRKSTGDRTFKSSNRPRFSRKRGKTPRQHNGMHRRRRKKIQW